MAPLDYTSIRLEYSAAFGETIVAWNRAEGAFRALLATLCGKSVAAQILQRPSLGGIEITNAESHSRHRLMHNKNGGRECCRIF